MNSGNAERKNIAAEPIPRSCMTKAMKDCIRTIDEKRVCSDTIPASSEVRSNCERRAPIRVVSSVSTKELCQTDPPKSPADPNPPTATISFANQLMPFPNPYFRINAVTFADRTHPPIPARINFIPCNCDLHTPSLFVSRDWCFDRASPLPLARPTTSSSLPRVQTRRVVAVRRAV